MADVSAGATAVDETRLRAVAAAAEAWKGQLVDVGGRNPLLYYKDVKQDTLDLRASDSDALAVDRLLGSHTVRLSEIFAPTDTSAATKERTAQSSSRRRDMRQRRAGSHGEGQGD